MTKATKTQRFQPIAIFIIVILSIFLSACTADGIGIQFADPNGGTASGTSAIVFAGKVTDKTTGQWLNDYTIIAYRNGEEIGRIDSKQGEYKYSEQGVHDGFFAIYLANDYKLTADDEFVYGSGSPLTMKVPAGQSSDSRYIFQWFGEQNPGAIIRIEVPAKQIEYVIAIMPVPNSELSEAILNGPTHIDENGVVTAPLNSDDQEVGTGGKGTGAQKTVVAPSDVVWTRPLTHFSGNRWQVWELYVRDQAPGMTWEQFKAGMVVHNQHLIQSGYVFQYYETYLLPTVAVEIAEN